MRSTKGNDRIIQKNAAIISNNLFHIFHQLLSEVFSNSITGRLLISERDVFVFVTSNEFVI
jgi:hypothetical protein